MGQYADDIIDGFCDNSGDYTYKDNIRKYKHSPETKAEKNIRLVRKELAILIKNKMKEFPKSNNNLITDICRKFINFKYGCGWRERGLVVNNSDQWKELSSYKTPEFDWNLELNRHKNNSF